jgi:hypothetical protein
VRRGSTGQAIISVLVWFAQKTKAGADVGDESVGLLKGGEVAAGVELVEVDDVAVAAFEPAAGLSRTCSWGSW